MPKVRVGKTRKDRLSGAKARNEGNKAAREAWMKGEEKTFPVHTCGGHRYRTRLGKKAKAK